MSAPDERTAETFRFDHMRDEGPELEGWNWQRGFIRWVHGCQRAIVLKARQLGITWLGCAYCVWTALYRPGSLSLIYRQKEEEAVENVVRCFRLLQSLPPWLWNGAVVEIPQRGAIPRGGVIELKFPDGSSSRIVAMTSASASGHGKTAAVVLLDEFSRIERAEEIMAAVQPAAGSRGKILIISTANGVSDPETGAGNHFHYLWSDEGSGFERRFLPWSLHPDRDQRWYDHDPEIRGLPSHRRAEQYPATEDEAFTLTNRVFFDPEHLAFYGSLCPTPVERFDFERVTAGTAKRVVGDRGMVRLYARPQPDRVYAVGADVATGRGRDYSAAFVVDLAEMQVVAEFHGRLDSDLYAFQLHYLGKWYRDALIAVETAGGYGESVIASLRDGREGRPPYRNLYKHVMSSRPDFVEAKPFGFPTNMKTRPLILNQLEKAIRERSLPFLTRLFLNEARTFVYHDTGTSPRAQDGARDDCVMALAIALEMYRLRGEHADRARLSQPRRTSLVGPGNKSRGPDISKRYAA